MYKLQITKQCSLLTSTYYVTSASPETTLLVLYIPNLGSLMHQFSSVFTMATSEVFTGFDNETLNFSGFMDTSMVFEPSQNTDITAMSAFDCSGFENSINRVDSLDPMDFTPVLTSSMTSDVLTSQLVNIPIGSLSPIPECNDQICDITVSDCNTTASITASFNNDDELLESPPLVVNVEQHRDTSYVPNEEEPVEDVTVNDTGEEIEEDLLNLSEPFTVQPGRPSHELRLIVNGTTKGKSCVHSKDCGL